MDITLSGNTKCFSLIFILKFLNSLKKSGKITLSGHALKGEIILKDGKITHAIYDQNKGEEALKVILAMTGNFQFIEGISFEEVTFPEGKGDKILKEAFGEWMDIQELSEIIPLYDSSFSIVPFKERNNQEPVTFSREEWMIISHINKYPIYEDLVSNTGLGGLKTGKILLDLHKNGYITYLTDMTLLQTLKDVPGLNVDLSRFKLKDIFHLIIDANVTGNLNIISNGNRADIYIENQIIMDAKSLFWPGDLAIAEAMSRQTGNCSFYKFTRQDKPDTLITITCEEIISGPSEKIIKLMEIAGEFKHSDAIFTLNEDSDAHGDEEDFAFSKKDLAIMMNIDGKRTLNDLSEQMDIPLYRLVENMYCLYKNGLIKLMEKEEVKGIPVEDKDTLIDLLHQEDKYDKEQLKATILFSEIDKDFLPFLNTTGTENQDDLLSLLNKENEGQEELKKSLLSQASEGDDLLSLLNKENEGQEELKKSLLSQASEGDDLLSLLNKENEGQEELKKSLLSQASEGDDLLSLLNKKNEGQEELKKSLLSQASEGDDLLSLLNKENEGQEELKKSLLSQASEGDDLLSLLNKENEGQEELKKSLLSQASEGDDLLSLLNKENEGQEELKKSLLSQASEGDDLLSLLNKENEGQEELKKSLLSQASEGDDLLSLLNKENEGQEELKKSLLSQASEGDDLLSLLNKENEGQEELKKSLLTGSNVNSYDDMLKFLNAQELSDKKKK